MFIILHDADTVLDTLKEAGDRFDSHSHTTLAQVAPAKETALARTRKYHYGNHRTASHLLFDGTAANDKQVEYDILCK